MAVATLGVYRWFLHPGFPVPRNSTPEALEYDLFADGVGGETHRKHHLSPTCPGPLKKGEMPRTVEGCPNKIDPRVWGNGDIGENRAEKTIWWVGPIKGWMSTRIPQSGRVTDDQPWNAGIPMNISVSR